MGSGAFFTPSNTDEMSEIISKTKVFASAELKNFSCRLSGHININRDANLGCAYCDSKKYDLYFGDEATHEVAVEDVDNQTYDMEQEVTDEASAQWVEVLKVEGQDDATMEPHVADYTTYHTVVEYGTPIVEKIEYNQYTNVTVYSRKSHQKYLVQGEDVPVEKSIEYRNPVSAKIVLDGNEYLRDSQDVDTFEVDEANSWKNINNWISDGILNNDPKAINTALRNIRLVENFSPRLENEVEIGTTNGYNQKSINAWSKMVRESGVSFDTQSPLVSPKDMYTTYQQWLKLETPVEKLKFMLALKEPIVVPMREFSDGSVTMWNDPCTKDMKVAKDVNGDFDHYLDEVADNANVFDFGNGTCTSKMPRTNFSYSITQKDGSYKYVSRLSKKNGKTSSSSAYKYEPHNLSLMMEIQEVSKGMDVKWNDETIPDIVHINNTCVASFKRYVPTFTYKPITFKKNRVCIVGTSKLDSLKSLEYVENHVKTVLAQYSPKDTVIISGNAKGVDTVAESVAVELGFEIESYKPEQYSREYFLARDRAMANMATRVISIVNPLKEQRCYHCEKSHKDFNHERSGGCYTGKYHGNYEVVVIDDGSPSSSTHEESSITPDNVDFKNIPDNVTVVVGTNNMNWHGRGVAKQAKDAGVIDTDKCYKFVTKYHPMDTQPPYLKPVSLDEFHYNADKFIEFVKANPERTFIMTAVGCGLAGFKPEQVKGFFKDVPSNVQLPSTFK